jgi:hypothetical protein
VPQTWLRPVGCSGLAFCELILPTLTACASWTWAALVKADEATTAVRAHVDDDPGPGSGTEDLGHCQLVAPQRVLHRQPASLQCEPGPQREQLVTGRRAHHEERSGQPANRSTDRGPVLSRRRPTAAGASAATPANIRLAGRTPHELTAYRPEADRRSERLSIPRPRRRHRHGGPRSAWPLQTMNGPRARVGRGPQVRLALTGSSVEDRQPGRSW